MKKINIKKIDKKIILLLIPFFIISILGVYSASNLIGNNTLFIKQIIWYIIGTFIIYLITKVNNNEIYKYYKIIYILGNLTLLLLLLFGKPINNAKCWINLGVFSFQPSEFMKLILIITNAIVIHNNRDKKDLIIILKVFLITLIPSILTFLEPDTGMVIIYFVISFVMLFLSKIDKKWFIISILILVLFITIFLSMYFYNSDTFINIFGTNFFYRIDRLLDWKNGTGYQLSNALIGIGSSFIFGFGFNNTPIYFPEAQTDFIFSIFAINYGFIGVILLFSLILYFDIYLISIGKETKNQMDKYIISGIIAMLIFQQIQNIGMNIGLLPIMGITLPFISYGGSSLISYMISMGIVLNITKNTKK